MPNAGRAGFGNRSERTRTRSRVSFTKCLSGFLGSIYILMGGPYFTRETSEAGCDCHEGQSTFNAHEVRLYKPDHEVTKQSHPSPCQQGLVLHDALATEGRAFAPDVSNDRKDPYNSRKAVLKEEVEVQIMRLRVVR